MKKILFASAFAAVAMMGCSTTADNAIEGTEPVPVLFGQSIEAFVKAPVEGATLTSTKFNLYALEYTGANSAWAATNFMDKVVMSADDNGDLTYGGGTKFYSNVADTKYEFYAFYPEAETEGITVSDAAAGAAPVVSFDCSTNQPDVLYAKTAPQTKSANKVPIAFTHQLAKLTINVKAAEGYTPNPEAKITKITVSAIPDGTMDLGTGAITLGSTAQEIDITGIAAEGQAVGAEAQIGKAVILPAQGITTLKITINGEEKTATFSSLTLLAANNNTLTLTFKGTEVGFDKSSVTPWGNAGNNGSGDVPL